MPNILDLHSTSGGFELMYSQGSITLHCFERDQIIPREVHVPALTLEHRCFGS